MTESTLTNLDGIPQYQSVDAHLYHSPNVDNSSKSMTIIVQNPFDDSSHNVHSQHPVRFNQELLDNFGISIPLSKQTTSMDHQSTTNLIPIPTPLSNNLGLNIHSMSQPSLTPTMIGTYPTYENHYQQPSSTIYHNTSRPMMVKHNQQIRSAPIIVRYPPPQQYAHPMMKPRMMPPNNTYPTSSQVIMSQPPPPQQQQQPMIYDPNSVYRTNGQLNHHLSQPDDNILKSLLQITPDVGLPTRPIDQSQMNQSKQRKKRKGNDLNTSFEGDLSPKVRKRKKKGTEETEKFVEYSLQQLRDLPMLTPVEPTIDIKDDFSLTFSSEQKLKSQGDFGDIFLKNLTDFYRPNRRAPPLIIPKSLSTIERHYRLCTNFLDQPPRLPSPPLMMNISEKFNEFSNHEDSIVSLSSIDDDDDDDDHHHHYQDENLLQTLSSSYDPNLRSLSPVFTSNSIQESVQPIVDSIDKVSVTLTLTTEAANNVQSVIAAVTDLLKMAYPSTFDVHQSLDTHPNCTCSNSNSKDLLSLSSSSIPISNINRSTSIYKLGRETSISIQTLIDNQPKYCRHCLQHLLTDNYLKKRINELPVHLRDTTSNSEPFVYFCNENCFNIYSQQPIGPINIKSEVIDVNLRSLPMKREIKENTRWKRWEPNLLLKTFVQPVNTEEINQLINDIRIPLSMNAKEDKRICVFCNKIGDLISDGPGRLLNLDVGQWCHLNCALWSYEVYETRCGALMSVEQAYVRSLNTECVICKQTGSSLSCFYQRCTNKYHFTCAIKNGCVFYKNKTIMCPIHATKTIANDEILEDKTVCRKVWINREEIKQIQNYMNEEHDDKSYILRIGSLILHNIGQLLPHQLQSSDFHNRNFIYPVGYTVTRFYWSRHHPNRRCAYLCSIIDVDNKPMFRIRVEEDNQIDEYLDSTAKTVWHKIVDDIDLLRRKHGLVKMFSVYITGEDLFGLTEPHIIRLIESLPGVEILQNYAFKYGRLQLFEMPLTVNPTGCARSEPLLRTHFRRHTQTMTSSHSTRNALPRTVGGIESKESIPYVKQFVLSKSTQYRKLKIEWRQNIYLAKSRIQGLGLFAARDLEKHTMVIEYIGELIRNEVANKREKLYEQQNRGIYMFRLDDNYVVDATMSGCLARYINHSCEPNAIAEVVQVEKENKIIIITNRRVAKGEELMYDYKFDFEEDSKIPCLCGAVHCRKWMN